MSTRESTADRILRCARALFERDGVQGVTMRRVADAAGVTPMAIYRHFRNREALLKRIGDDSFDALARHWSARGRGGDVLTRLVAVQRIYLDYALAHPHLFDQAFSLPRSDARRYPEDFQARRSPTLVARLEAHAPRIVRDPETGAWWVTTAGWPWAATLTSGEVAVAPLAWE